MKVSPVSRPSPVGTNERSVQQFRTTNPAMRDKMQAAAKAPPPPVPAPIPNAPAQQTNIEAPAGAAAEATSPQSLSPHFAALARKERQFRRAQQEFKAAQEAWKKQQGDFIPRSSLQTDPLKTLSEAGVSYDRLVELQLGQPAHDPQAHLQQEIEDLKAQLAASKTEWKSAEEQRDVQAREQAVGAIKQDVELLVEADPAYETIKATKSHHEVVDLITKVFDAEGIMLSVEEAARQVEELLVEKTAEQVKLYSELSKIKSKLAPPAEEPPQQAYAARMHERQPPSQQPKTLTNAQGVQRPLSPTERAIQAFERARLRQ